MIRSALLGESHCRTCDLESSLAAAAGKFAVASSVSGKKDPAEKALALGSDSFKVSRSLTSAIMSCAMV
jgi:hypothetical protein